MDLVNWAETYKDIYNMDSSRRPSQEIIDNDTVLDKYLANLIRKSQTKGS